MQHQNECIKSYGFSIDTFKVSVNKIGTCILIQKPNYNATKNTGDKCPLDGFDYEWNEGAK